MKIRMSCVALVAALLATTAFATVGEQVSSVTDPYQYPAVPTWLQDYFVAIDLWLNGIFWKYIMYGTWYVLFDQIYCEFLIATLDPILSGISEYLALTVANDEAKTACHAGFWLFYDALFYEGNYAQRPFAL